jgi:hypothetical protein
MHESVRTCGPKPFSGTIGTSQSNQALDLSKTTPTGPLVPFAIWDRESDVTGSAGPVPVWDQLSCRCDFQKLNPLNNQVGPVVPENTLGPHHHTVMCA